jgi:putative ABC transport system permease protein
VSKLSIGPAAGYALLQPEMVAGRWLLPGETNSIVVSDTIYDYFPGLRPGDRLMVKLPGRAEEPWEVVGVFRFVDMMGDPMAYANFDFIAGRTHLPDQAASYRAIRKDHDAASSSRSPMQ